MENFRSLSEALKKGYKITDVSYHQCFDEWCITCELIEYSHIKRAQFWRKKLPKYLKWRDFENEGTNRNGLLEITIVLDLDNQ